MADKDIQMKHHDGNKWNDIFPKTKPKNITNESLNLSVGSGGDHSTISDAIQEILDTTLYPRGTITLQSGFTMNEQVKIVDMDLSGITIESSGDVTVSANGIPNVSVNASPEFDIEPMFYGVNSKLPKIDAKFTLNSSDSNVASGMLLDNSTVLIGEGKGFTDFPFIGLCLMNGSHATAHHGVFDDNGNRDELNDDGSNIDDAYGDGVRVWNSTFSGSYATAHRCGDMGFHITQGSQAFINKAESVGTGHHGVLVTTGSTCSARGGVFTDTIDDNVTCYAGSKIDFRDGDASRSTLNYGLIVTRSSEANFENGVANDCGYSGIMANRTSMIDATGATSNDSKEDGVRSANSSFVNFTNGTALRSGHDGLHCTHGSTIQAREATIKESNNKGALAYLAQIYANEATISGSGVRNLEATRGGYISAHNCDLTGAGEISVLAYGSKIYCSESNVDDANKNALKAHYGGEITANDTTLTNAGDIAVFADGGTIYCSNSNLNGSPRRGIECTRGGFVVAEGCTINGATDKGVLCYASYVNINGSDVLNVGERAIECTQSGEIIARNVDTTGSGGNGFSVYNCGRIIANGGTGESNRTENEITSNGLIMR